MNGRTVMDKGAGMVGSLSGQAVQLPTRRVFAAKRVHLDIGFVSLRNLEMEVRL